MKMYKVALIILMLVIPSLCIADEELSVYTAAMQATYKIQGDGSMGTCFILSKKVSQNPNVYYSVLVTAGHVLENMKGDKAIVFLRKKKGDSYEKYPVQLQIRNGGNPLWTKHPSADVALMYVPIPEDSTVIALGENLLVTDGILSRIDVHPGDELLCLGYPLGFECNEAGFPVLRSGRIASYPILPTKMTKTLLLDFKVFEGNSGGPVLFAYPNRVAHGSELGKEFRGIIGLVIEKQNYNETTETRTETLSETTTETKTKRTPLDLAIVVHASLIKEALDLLPPLGK